MKHLLAAFILISMAIVALKIAFAFLILAGLIFRTKQTVSVLLLLALVALASAFPTIAIAIAVLAAGYALYNVGRNRRARPLKSHTWKLTDDSND